MNPKTVHWLYSSPITSNVSSAASAIKMATTMKVTATCSQNSRFTVDFLVVCDMTTPPFFDSRR